jgi:hypothetical protein
VFSEIAAGTGKKCKKGKGLFLKEIAFPWLHRI